MVAMDSPRKTARMAGALYLVSAIAAGVPLIYVSGTLAVAGNAAATAGNILASETLFRASMVSELAGAVIFIFMVRALYRLLVGVDKAQASLMVTLVLISVPITFLNVLMEVAALACSPASGRSGRRWPCCASTCTPKVPDEPIPSGDFGSFPSAPW